MTRTRPLDLQRLHHVPDELLRSRDLRDQAAADAELLYWHQRALHDAGVAAGLTLDRATPGEVGVAPGIGYEGSGRDVRLLEATTVAVPAADEHAMALVLRGRGGGGGGLAWISLSDLDRCRGVPVALLRRGATVPEPWPSRARTVARPRIGSGATPPDATQWEPWAPLARRSDVRGLQVRIDTRAAGFTALPCYFAALQGPDLAGLAPPQILPLGRQYVEEESTDGFTFRVIIAVDRLSLRILGRGMPAAAATAYGNANRLWVSWLGIQCDPAPTAMSLKDVMR